MVFHQRHGLGFGCVGLVFVGAKARIVKPNVRPEVILPKLFGGVVAVKYLSSSLRLLWVYCSE